MKIFYQIVLIVFCSVIFTLANAQYAVGDFGSLATGSWGVSNANWRQWNGIAWATIPAGAPTATDNVWILSGHTVTVEASPKTCKNLNIETGAKLFANVGGATIRYVSVFGDITNNGTIGNGTTTDGISFNIEGTSCLISGSGVFDASRIRKNAITNPTTNLTIGMNINLRFGTSSTTQLYNNASPSTLNVTVNSGATLNLTGGAFLGNICIDGLAGAGGTSNGTFTINGNLLVSGILYLITNNAAGSPCSWVIGPTGYVRANEVRAGPSGAGTHSLTINSGGKLEINGTPSISTFSTTNNTYTCQPGSTVEYSAAGAQTVRAGIVYSNLNFSGSGNKTTDGNTTVGNNLTISGTASFVAGTYTINVGGNWTNYGTTGFTEGTSTVNWNGSNAQQMTCTGGEDFYALSMNNSSATGLTLNNAATVSNVLTMNDGLIYSTSVNLLTLNANASTTGASNASFVSGPIRYLGNNALTFPVGKNSDYQALGISAGAASGGTFWTETFNNGCASGCSANGVNTGNGTWAIDNSNNPPFDNCGDIPQSNVWYVSCRENGNGNGNCGSGCGANATLHIGSTTLGDQGASFDAGGYCDVLGGGFGGGTNTNTMVVSPTISTIGKTNITLTFDYLHYGAFGSDWGWVDYSINNGASWNTLQNPMAQVTCCGGPCDNSHQGRWDNFSTVLPVAAENIAGFKLRFGWINDDDMAGNDPSFAIDNIILSTPTITTSFTCEYFYSNPQIPYGNLLVPSLDHISNCEYWILSRDAGSENKYVTLTFDGNSCLMPAVTTDLRVARHDGISTWQNEGNSATSGTIASGTVTSNLVTSFSPFTIGSIAPAVLPVELLDFNAKPIYDKVQLAWSTASEINNDYFTVQRSVDGYTFIDLMNVKGAGNSSANENYITYDTDPIDGKAYYRLKQVDFNGMFVFSPIRMVYFDDENNPSIFPNPNDGTELYIQFDQNLEKTLNSNIIITDMAGRKIAFESIMNTSKTGLLKLKFYSKLAPGTYLVQLNSNSTVISKRLVVR